MVDHLQHGAVGAEAVGREELVRDQPHLRERRVSDDAAHVGGAEREQRAVHEPDRGEHEDRHPEVVRRSRELADRDPEEAVGSHLRDHAGEEGRHLGRRLAVGVGQPAVERPERRLDGERDREAEEEPVVRARRHPRQVERSLLQAVDDDRGEHQQRARDRIDDERDRRAHPRRSAPDADQDVERDQHRLEERVEQEQVLRDEDADDGAGEEEQEAEVRARALASDPPRIQARRRAADDRQADEPEGVAELADVVADAEVAEPRPLLRELELAAAEVEVLDGRDPDGDLDERDERRDASHGLRRHRHEPDEQGTGDRQEDQDRGQPARHRVERKTTARTATPLASASAYERTSPF